MSPKPTTKYAIDPTAMSMRFFIMRLVLFFARQKPPSTMANPACMRKTMEAAIISQRKSSATVRSSPRVSAPPGSAASAVPGTASRSAIASTQGCNSTLRIGDTSFFAFRSGLGARRISGTPSVERSCVVLQCRSASSFHANTRVFRANRGAVSFVLHVDCGVPRGVWHHMARAVL